MNQPTIVKPCLTKIRQKTFQQNNCYCVYDESLLKEFHLDVFSGDYWQANNSIIGTAQGRGTTYFIAHEQQQWVLRHYYRGGLIGRLINDSYIFTGLEKTRAAQEYSLLEKMIALGLPAPQPVAYQVIKHGLTYQADIITARIENAQDLVAILQQRSLTPTLWQYIGKTIKQFHDHGIYHHDLNIHNILIDDKDKVWLIDFDRGEQRNIAEKWQQQNIERLLRSFKKEQGKLSSFYWQDDNWQQLMQGYQLSQ
ncbi:MAG: 3-deoxy-D-manno-octulosonic acid kinase [Thalassotalea sp.]